MLLRIDFGKFGFFEKESSFYYPQKPSKKLIIDNNKYRKVSKFGAECRFDGYDPKINGM